MLPGEAPSEGHITTFKFGSSVRPGKPSIYKQLPLLLNSDL